MVATGQAFETTATANGTVPPVPVREFRREGLGFVWEPREHAVRLRVDYLRERADEYTGEIVVENTRSGEPTHLHQARYNLVSTPQRQSLAKHLADVTRDRTPWGSLIERFSTAVLRKLREGEPVLRVGNLPYRGRTPDLIERLLPAGKPTFWYGPGGVGKGWFATAAAVCHEKGAPLGGLAVRQGHALYLDWEDNEYSLNERVQALVAGLALPPPVPEIAYRKCKKPLTRDINQLMRHVADVGADLVIVDSFGPAAGAAGERSYEDLALGFFEALRLLEPATVLIVDHVSGAGVGQDAKVVGKAFGSVYKMNEARCAWEIRSEQEPGESESIVGFYHTKYNHSQRYPAIGFRLAFSEVDPGDAPVWVTIKREDIRDSAVLSKSMPIKDQIVGALKHGAASPKQIAEDVGQNEAAVRAALNRHKDRLFAKLVDGRWGWIDTTHTRNGGGAWEG